MMKKIILGFALLLSFSVFADCSTIKNHQNIVISKVAGTVQVVDKQKSETCIVTNDLSQKDPLKKSTLTWTFKGLNCLPGQCFIRFHGEQPGAMALRCGYGSPNNSQCKVRVNNLTKQCASDQGPNCTLSYDIVVRGQVIDPTIIIKPRPFSDGQYSAAYLECEAAGGYALDDNGVCLFEEM